MEPKVTEISGPEGWGKASALGQDTAGVVGVPASGDPCKLPLPGQ